MLDSTLSVTTGDLPLFPSAASLRAAHSELLKHRRQDGDDPQFIESVGKFIKQAQATGVLLDSDEDRYSSQSLLDYWANYLVRAGQDVPDATLADFLPELAPHLDDSLCPYRGLNPFGEENQAQFFGRQNLIDEMIAQLKKSNFLAVVGASGSGKSSAVLAGLIPALKTGKIDGSQKWRYFPIIVPGSKPLERLAAIIRTETDKPGHAVHDEAERLRENSDHLRKVIEASGNIASVIVIDQFEEIFSLCDSEPDRKMFIANLVNLVRYPGSAHFVILTMREDFEYYVARDQALSQEFSKSKIEVKALLPSELRDAIKKPADLVGLKFEDGIIDKLISDIHGEPAGLPLLQFALLYLWEQREGNFISWKIFQKAGDCRKILSRSADKFYENEIHENQVAVKSIFLAMVQPGEGFEVTSKRVAKTDLYNLGIPETRIDRVLTKMIDAGLIRLTLGKQESDAQVEIAHEALVRNWQTLVDWLNEARVNLRKTIRLNVDARRWEAMGRDSSALLRGAMLNEALLIDGLKGPTKEFVDCSNNYRLKKKRRKNLAITIVCLLLLATTVYSLIQRGNAIKDRDKATSRQIAAQALSSAEYQYDVALLLSLEAFRINENTETTGSIFAMLEQYPRLTTFQHGHTLPVNALAFMPARDILASGSDDNSIIIWDNVSHQQLTRLTDHEAPVMCLAYSPDGKLLASGSQDNKLILWETSNNKNIHSFDNLYNGTSINSITFSPDNNMLVWVDLNQSVTICDLTSLKEAGRAADRQKISSFPVGERQTTSIAFNPANGTLALVTQYKGLILCDVKTQKEIRTFSTQTDLFPSESMLSVVFSRDGKRVAASTTSGNVFLWDSDTGQLLNKFSGQIGKITCLAFNADGTRLAAGAVQRMIIIWDTTSYQQVDRFPSHAFEVRSIAYDSEGKSLASAGDDNYVMIWNDSPHRLETPFKGSDATIYCLAISPDGKTIATGNKGRFINLWDVDEKKEISPLISQGIYSNCLAFSPDSSTLASPNEDGSIALWDVAAKKIIRQLKNGQNKIDSLAFSPDGRILASGNSGENSDAAFISLWDLNGQQLIGELHGHIRSVYSLSFTSDSKTLASGGKDNAIIFWDVATLKQSAKLEGHKDIVLSVAFGRNDEILASGSRDRTIILWDVATKRKITQLTGHKSEVSSVTFNKSGDKLASSSSDTTIIIWDVASQRLLGRPLDPRNRASSEALKRLFYFETSFFHKSRNRGNIIAFNADGTKLATPGSTGTVSLWEMGMSEWKRLVCATANRNFTLDEWTEYISHEKYHTTCEDLTSQK